MANVVITGASSGIGEHLAREFSNRGDNLLLVARREDRLKELSRELRAEYQVVDLSCEKETRNLAESLKQRSVDILVNNAGRGSFGFYEDQYDDVLMIKLNAIAPTILSQAVIPQMKERKSGKIVFISSVCAFVPIPFMTTYAATKAFNYFQGRSLARELEEFGVKVVTVCPGPVNTEFGGVARVPGSMTGLPRDRVEEVAKEILEKIDQEIILPGVWGKFLGTLTRGAPHRVSTFFVKRSLRKLVS